MTERDPLGHAREEHRRVYDELQQRERDLALQLITAAQEQLQQHEKDLQDTEGLIKEIPERPSLDHSATKREAIKELAEMQRQVGRLRQKIEKLRGVSR
jgi:hypothetical protein